MLFGGEFDEVGGRIVGGGGEGEKRGRERERFGSSSVTLFLLLRPRRLRSKRKDCFVMKKGSMGVC